MLLVNLKILIQHFLNTLLKNEKMPKALHFGRFLYLKQNFTSYTEGYQSNINLRLSRYSYA